MISVKSLAVQEWVLRLLGDAPLSAGEISERMFEEVWEAWAERNGLGGAIEWRSRESEPFGARLIAFSEAKAAGLAPLHSWQLLNHLYRMERDELVARIALDGHRPILWRLPAQPSAEDGGKLREEREPSA